MVEFEKMYWLKPSTIDGIQKILEQQMCILKKLYVEHLRDDKFMARCQDLDDLTKITQYHTELEMARLEQIAKSKRKDNDENDN